MNITALFNAFDSLRKRDGDLETLIKTVFFYDLMNKYPKKTIRQVSLDYKGGSWGNDFFNEGIAAKVLRSPDIRFGFIDFENAQERYFTEKELQNFRLKDNDVLVIKSNGSLDLVGKSQIFKSNTGFKNVVASNFLMVISPNTKIIFPEYLDLFLKSPEALIWRFDTQKTTTGLRNLNTNAFLDIELPVPETIEEQIKLYRNYSNYLKGIFTKDEIVISKFYRLARLKEGVSKELTFQLTQLENLNQAILQEAVQGKLVPQNPADEPASQLLKRIKAEKAKSGKKEKSLPPIKPEEIPFEIPESWVWCRLGEITDFISGNNFESGDFYKGDGVKCIKITNAGVRDIIETDDVLPLSFREKYKQFLVYKGDLVLALTRPYISTGLKISVCPLSYNESLLNQRVAVIRSFDGVTSQYIYQFLSSNIVLKKYQSMFEGQGQQPNLKKEDVTNLLFPLPPLSEQKRIVAEIEKQLAQTKQLKEHIISNQQATEQLLKALLHEAFEVN